MEKINYTGASTYVSQRIQVLKIQLRQKNEIFCIYLNFGMCIWRKCYLQHLKTLHPSNSAFTEFTMKSQTLMLKITNKLFQMKATSAQ